MFTTSMRILAVLLSVVMVTSVFSGMGFTVMESFTDSLSVKSTPGKGTKVTLKKKLSPLQHA